MEVLRSVTSPDGKRVASIVRDAGKEFIVLDGEEGKKYEYWIEKGSLTFSPDSQRFAYVVRDSDGEFVVIDGREEKRRGWVDRRLIFSPNSRRFAYVVRRKSLFSERNTYFVVVDGKRGKSYGRIKPPVFDSDSRFLAYVAANEGPVRATRIGPARLLEQFWVVVNRDPACVRGFFKKARTHKALPIPGAGDLTVVFSSDSKVVQVVERGTDETRCIVQLDDLFET